MPKCGARKALIEPYPTPARRFCSLGTRRAGKTKEQRCSSRASVGSGYWDFGCFSRFGSCFSTAYVVLDGQQAELFRGSGLGCRSAGRCRWPMLWGASARLISSRRALFSASVNGISIEFSLKKPG